MPNRFGYTRREDIPMHRYTHVYLDGAIARDSYNVYERRGGRFITLSDAEVIELLRPEAQGDSVPVSQTTAVRRTFMAGSRYRAGDYVEYLGVTYVNTGGHRSPYCAATPGRYGRGRHCWAVIDPEWQSTTLYDSYRPRVRHNGGIWRSQRSWGHVCLNHEPVMDGGTGCWEWMGSDTTPSFVAPTPPMPAVGAPNTANFRDAEAVDVYLSDGAPVGLTRRDEETQAQFYDRIHATVTFLRLFPNGNVPEDYPYTSEDRANVQVTAATGAAGSSMDEPDPPADPQAASEPVFEPHREEHAVIPVGKKCSCEACKAIANEDNILFPGTFVGYSYEPERWTLNKITNDPDNFYFGVELETDNTKHLIDNARAASMARPSDFWLAKTDASVSGPEFVSFPGTLSYWREHYDELEDMFGMLLHAGFRSHDGGNAGMHINMSRSSFGDPNHLYRFLTLLHHTPSWALTLSQRSRDQSRHWADLTTLADRATRRRVAQSGRNAAGGRYFSLNLSNRNRLEFRLPRGTLRVDRFFKNLEWVHAMVQYTREKPLAKCTPKEFMRWVNAGQYPYLHAFLGEKFDGAVR